MFKKRAAMIYPVKNTRRYPIECFRPDKTRAASLEWVYCGYSDFNEGILVVNDLWKQKKSRKHDNTKE